MASKRFLLIGIFFLVVVLEPFFVVSGHGQPPAKGFDFLRRLRGSHKGQTVRGLSKLKCYLKKFGYLNYKNTSHENDDVFDDCLDFALKAYQANYHLKVSGALDEETITKMTLPRCGVPDQINKNTTMEHYKTSHNVSHYEFFPGRLKWPSRKTRLTYTFKSSARPIPAKILRSACARAFMRWQRVSHFTFVEAPWGKRADIVIGFHRRFHGWCKPFDGPGGVLAHSFPPTMGICHFDADENWSTRPRSRREVDLESVAVHEIGHLLGLDHSYNLAAIMYPYFYYGEIKRELHSDDIIGIKALYKSIY